MEPTAPSQWSDFVAFLWVRGISSMGQLKAAERSDLDKMITEFEEHNDVSLDVFHRVALLSYLQHKIHVGPKPKDHVSAAAPAVTSPREAPAAPNYEAAAGVGHVRSPSSTYDVAVKSYSAAQRAMQDDDDDDDDEFEETVEWDPEADDEEENEKPKMKQALDARTEQTGSREAEESQLEEHSELHPDETPEAQPAEAQQGFELKEVSDHSAEVNDTGHVRPPSNPTSVNFDTSSHRGEASEVIVPVPRSRPSVVASREERERRAMEQQQYYQRLDEHVQRVRKRADTSSDGTTELVLKVSTLPATALAHRQSSPAIVISPVNELSDDEKEDEEMLQQMAKAQEEQEEERDMKHHRLNDIARAYASTNDDDHDTDLGKGVFVQDESRHLGMIYGTPDVDVVLSKMIPLTYAREVPSCSSHVREALAYKGYLLSWLIVYFFVHVAVTIVVVRSAATTDNTGLTLARVFGQLMQLNAAVSSMAALRTLFGKLKQLTIGRFVPLQSVETLHRRAGSFSIMLGVVHAICIMAGVSAKGTDSVSEVVFSSNSSYNSTGVLGTALLFMTLLAAVFSLECWRARRFFSTYYYAHMLHGPWVMLLLVHSSTAWIWLFFPIMGGVMELMYRCHKTVLDTIVQSATLISSDELMLLDCVRMSTQGTLTADDLNPLFAVPAESTNALASVATQASFAAEYWKRDPERLVRDSRYVIKLRLERPEHYNFNPGDSISLSVPSLGPEWHSFPITSAPELAEVLYVHIDVAGMSLGRDSHLKADMGPNAEEEDDDDMCSRAEEGLWQCFAGESRTQHWAEGLLLLIQSKQESAVRADSRGGFRTSSQLNMSDEQRQKMDVRLRQTMALRAVPLRARLDVDDFASSFEVIMSQHPVIIGSRCTVYPFASLLASLWFRHLLRKDSTYSADYRSRRLSALTSQGTFRTQKVDLFWLNPRRASRNVFDDALSYLKTQRMSAEHQDELRRFIDLHLYADDEQIVRQWGSSVTAEQEQGIMSPSTLMHHCVQKKRPQWSQIFDHLTSTMAQYGAVTVFYVGPEGGHEQTTLKELCDLHGFGFRRLLGSFHSSQFT